MFARLLSLVLGAGCVILAGLPVAAMDSTNKSAFSAYNAGDYATAERQFRELSAETPGEPSLHYYRANSLYHLGRIEEARAEYLVCSHIAPGTSFASYAEKALGTLTDTDQKQSAAAGLAEQASAAATLKQQVGSDGARATQEIGQLSAQAIMDRARALAALADEEAQRQGTTSNSAKIIERAKQLSEYVQQEHANRAKSDLDLSSEQERLLRNSATSLSEQLGATNVFGFGLRAKGTNLYIRNYGADSDGGTKQFSLPAELLADQDKLILTRRRQPDPRGLHATPRFLDFADDSRFSQEVQGKLLPGSLRN